MLHVLRIERVGIVTISETNDPLLRATTHHSRYVVPEPLDGCLECIRIDPTRQVMHVELNNKLVWVVTGTLLKRSQAPSDAEWYLMAVPSDTVVPDTPHYPDGKLQRIPVIYGRCEASMRWLDGLYRGYVERFPFKRSLAIRSVAGSGKTTTLMKLAEQFKEERECDKALQGKRILYVAFNKQLVEDIRRKLGDYGLHHVLVPMTFDALVKRVAEARFAKAGRAFHLVGALTPQSLTEYNSWFAGKPFPMKKGLINQFAQFCQDSVATHPRELFPGKQMLAQLWEDTKQGTFLTFDGLRKRAHLEHWMKDVLDQQYARIFVDEAQDFDPIMLDILLTDTTVPKVFVGDPKQQIYEWRGTINAFERLPSNTLTLEFYTTFRMGEPATSQVAALTETPMISGVPNRHTMLNTDTTQCFNATRPAIYVSVPDLARVTDNCPNTVSHITRLCHVLGARF